MIFDIFVDREEKNSVAEPVQFNLGKLKDRLNILILLGGMVREGAFLRIKGLRFCHPQKDLRVPLRAGKCRRE